MLRPFSIIVLLRKKATQEHLFLDYSAPHLHCKHACSGSGKKTRALNSTLHLYFNSDVDAIHAKCGKDCKCTGKRNQPNSYVKLFRVVCSRTVWYISFSQPRVNFRPLWWLIVKLSCTHLPLNSSLWAPTHSRQHNHTSPPVSTRLSLPKNSFGTCTFFLAES